MLQVENVCAAIYMHAHLYLFRLSFVTQFLSKDSSWRRESKKNLQQIQGNLINTTIVMCF